MKRKPNHPLRERLSVEQPWEEDLDRLSWGQGDDLNQIAEAFDHPIWENWLADHADDDPAARASRHAGLKARSF